MSTEIDRHTLALLQGLVGKSILEIAGLRYPGVAGYSELLLHDDAGRTVSLTLRMVDVTAELEVCVPVARLTAPLETHVSADRLALAGFRVAHVYKLQRRECLEAWTSAGGEYVGSDPREHLLVSFDDGDGLGTDVVDAGIAVESVDGISLECCADSFPLVFQLRLTVAGSHVPAPKKVAIA